MNKVRGNEKGAIIIEVIAVIALLGVLGPLLFRQVLSRNEEVDNINIATEVRTVKEAFSAYILTNKQYELSRTEGCKLIPQGTLEEYVPYGMEDVVDSYDLVLCVIGGDNKFIEGFIVPDASGLPEKMGLKRAARIANIIGADGGIYNGIEVAGVAGGWQISASDLEDGFSELRKILENGTRGGVFPVATTGMDTYVPEYIVEDYSSGYVTIPDNLAFKQMHAENYFSVGPGKCYDKKHNTMKISDSGYTADDDVIYLAGSNNCEPLFWVGSESGSSDYKDRRVYARNSLMVVGEKGKKSGVGIFVKDGSTPTSALKDRTGIEVYNSAGDAKVIINDRGEIIVRNEYNGSDALDNSMDTYAKYKSADASDELDKATEVLVIADGMIKSNIKAPLSQSDASDSTLTYRVDPAYTSVMKDIRLEARGGARLSEILPNYITKEITSIKGNGSITMPGCPNGYAPAIMVTPTGWEKVKITQSDVEDLGLKTNSDKTDGMEGTAESHEHSINPIDVNASNESELQNAGIYIRINSDEDNSNGFESESSNKTGTWSVNFYYPDSKKRTDVTAVVQTFCVYDKTYEGELNRK